MKTAAIVRRSFIAMFWGWVACNCTSISVFLINQMIQGEASGLSLFWIYWLLVTAHVIFAAWLLFFLPADLLIKESSFLRTPAWAGFCGGLAGFVSVWLPLWFAAFSDLGEPHKISLLAGVCGLTASLHLVLHHPRKEQASPQSRDGGVPASLSNNPPNDL